MKRSWIVRGLVSFILLVTLAVYYLEPAAGDMRDGAVHHETAAEAMFHAAAHQHGHHLHVFGGSPDGGHGPDHEHGSSTDHCTHIHAPAHPGTWDVEATGFEESVLVASWVLPAPSSYTPLPDHHPPRF